jgi:acetoacetyl-CoA reductase
MTSQTHVVTGATDGIGLQTAKLLAQRGAHVLVHGRAEEKARKAVEVLSDKLPDARFTPVWGDLGRLAEVRTLAEQVRHHAPVLDGLVNNAGVFMKAWSETVDGFETTFQVNHLSHFLLTSLLLPELKAAPQGRVVNVSSVNGIKGAFGQTNYAAAKAGMHGFTKALAQEVVKKGVTVNTISPGYVATDMVKAIKPDVLQQIVATIPMGRLAEPDEIGGLVAYLCSEEAGSITGSNIAINGGLYLA